MRIILSLLGVTFFLVAQTIPQLIERSLSSHPSLKTIELRISAMDERIAKSRNFANPDVSLTINDIHYDDISNRSLEPMQYSAIKVKQKFPWFGKRDAKSSYERAKKNLLFGSLQAAQVKLAEAIRINAYTLKEIDERIHTLNDYQKVLKQTTQLHNTYNSTQANHHSGIISSQLALSKVKIKLASYRAVKAEQKSNLEYLTQSNIKEIKIQENITKPRSLHHYLARLKDNRDYHITLARAKVAKADTTIKELAKYADPFVQVGHFSRQDYPDYASVSVGLSLPLYGSEQLDTEASHKEALATQSLSIDYRAKVTQQIKTIYAKLQESYQVYRIITDESLSQIAHLFELSVTSVQSGENLLGYSQLLREKLQLDEQRISTKAHYRRNRAKLKALIGELQ